MFSVYLQRNANKYVGSTYDVPADPAKDITSSGGLKGKPMSPNEFLVVNEERQKMRHIKGEQPEYVNFNNAATKFLLDQVDNNLKAHF